MRMCIYLSTRQVCNHYSLFPILLFDTLYILYCLCFLLFPAFFHMVKILSIRYKKSTFRKKYPVNTWHVYACLPGHRCCVFVHDQEHLVFIAEVLYLFLDWRYIIYYIKTRFLNDRKQTIPPTFMTIQTKVITDIDLLITSKKFSTETYYDISVGIFLFNNSG